MDVTIAIGRNVGTRYDASPMPVQVWHAFRRAILAALDDTGFKVTVVEYGNASYSDVTEPHERYIATHTETDPRYAQGVAADSYRALAIRLASIARTYQQDSIALSRIITTFVGAE